MINWLRREEWPWRQAGLLPGLLNMGAGVHIVKGRRGLRLSVSIPETEIAHEFSENSYCGR